MTTIDLFVQLSAILCIGCFTYLSLVFLLKVLQLHETSRTVAGLGFILNFSLCALSSICSGCVYGEDHHYTRVFLEFSAFYTFNLSIVSFLFVVTTDEDGEDWRMHWTWKQFVTSCFSSAV